MCCPSGRWRRGCGTRPALGASKIESRASREKACAARGTNVKYAFEACQRSCATCPGSGEVCKLSSDWAFEGVKRLNCDWVAEKRERCTESGILMEEFEESEDDEDPNKPGPVEAYAFRACGKACGTCE